MSANQDPMLRTGSGLRLALGSAKIRLLDLAAAYGFLVRGGTVTSPVGILGVTADSGQTWRPVATTQSRVATPQTSADTLGTQVPKRTQ